MILSQWEVDDEASFRFMSEFYNRLFLGNSVQGAFRQVRDGMKAQNVPPSDWLNWRLIRNN